MPDVDETCNAIESVAANELREAVDDARARTVALLEPACPTPAFLAALERELGAAATAPSSVPYPELLDPDAYWSASVKPHNEALHRSASEIVAWLVERVVTAMGAAEEDLKAIVEQAADDARDGNPAAVRAELRARVDQRCTALHNLLAEALTIVPPASMLGDAERVLGGQRRAQAAADVESLKVAYLREAGGDEAHQRYAAEEWAATFEERVDHREALLRGEVPWRHMELALVGFARLRDQLERVVGETVAGLQAPLVEMRDLLVQRYDELVASS